MHHVSLGFKQYLLAGSVWKPIWLEISEPNTESKKYHENVFTILNGMNVVSLFSISCWELNRVWSERPMPELCLDYFNGNYNTIEGIQVISNDTARTTHSYVWCGMEKCTINLDYEWKPFFTSAQQV